MANRKKRTDMSAAEALILGMGPIDGDAGSAAGSGGDAGTQAPAPAGGSGEEPSGEAVLMANPPKTWNPRRQHLRKEREAKPGADGKRPRFNLALTDENARDLPLAAAAYNMSQTEFMNRVLSNWFARHESDMGLLRRAAGNIDEI